VSHFTRLDFHSDTLLKFWTKAGVGGFLSTESVRFTRMANESGSGNALHSSSFRDGSVARN